MTSRITHATPASFSAHVVDRNMESLIASYQLGNYSLGRRVDLMFGGNSSSGLSSKVGFAFLDQTLTLKVVE